MATINDISRRAGVSKATVSRVLSYQGYVSEAARTAVLRAAEELHYLPNVMARGLRTKRSGLIALLIPQIVSTYFVSLARGVEDMANKNGYHLILCNTDDSLEKQRAYIDLLVGSSVDGVMVAAASRSPRGLRRLIERKIPAVLVDRMVDNFPTDIVRGDSFGGMQALTRHLLDLGHQRIAFVNGSMDTSPAVDRLAGFRAAHEQVGLQPDERLITDGTWLVEDAEARVAGLLDARTPFTAVAGANSFMSIGAIRALRSRKLSVPRDVALAGFDDVELASDIDPFLTAMTQPVYTMGTFAMNMLLERIDGTYTASPRDVVLSPWLVVRRSCGSSSGSGRREKPSR